LSVPGGTLRSVRPALKAGLLPVWRDRETVQIGIDPRRAIALTGMAGAAPVLALLDGSRDRAEVIAAALALGVPEQVTDRVLTVLAVAGALDDFPAAALRSLPPGRRRRLGAELAAAALARGHSDAGATALARRDAASVRVFGPGRLATAIADILTTSGAGHVAIADLVRRGGGQRPGQIRPGGGHSRAAAGAALPVPDLAIVTGRAGPGLRGWLMRAGVPHLAVAADEAIGVVGPLVRPGQTACLRCLDISRASRDPAWPLILAQVAGRAAEPPACDAALSAAVAAQAAAQALAVLDRAGPASPAENGTLELVLPGWQWRRRSWPQSPSCGCRRYPAA
jgi:bacteriocin biosynthesis cyclodehydratase domain-containing protein